MNKPAPFKGFTLIELMVVIAIIGILAAIAMASYSQYKNRALATATGEELRSFRSAFYAHLAANESFPPDATAGVVPVGMETLLRASQFSKTPVGGTYNWEGLPGHPIMGIAVDTPTVSNEVMEILDRLIDDGNLSSGKFTQSGTRFKLAFE